MAWVRVCTCGCGQGRTTEKDDISPISVKNTSNGIRNERLICYLSYILRWWIILQESLKSPGVLIHFYHRFQYAAVFSPPRTCRTGQMMPRATSQLFTPAQSLHVQPQMEKLSQLELRVLGKSIQKEKHWWYSSVWRFPHCHRRVSAVQVPLWMWTFTIKEEEGESAR